jgi:hypothetical protein
MFSAIVPKALQLKRVITILNNLFISICVNVDNDYLHILMVTPCKSMLFNVKIELEQVEGADTPFTFNVNARHFLQSLSTLKIEDSVRLSVSESVDRLYIDVLSKTHPEKAFLFISQSQPLTFGEESEYDNVIEDRNSKFQKLCKELGNISSEFVVKGTSYYFTLAAKLEAVYGKEAFFGDIDTIDVAAEHETTYSAENFLNIAKIATISKVLYFYVSEDKPFGIEAKFGDRSFIRILIKKQESLT